MTDIGNKEIMARNLAYYVDRSGKTQKELAEIAGVATSTFNDWMKAKKYPRIDKIERLANYFGCLKSDLIEAKPKNKARQIMIDELNCLTDAQRELIAFAESIPEDKAERVLSMLKLMLED